MVKKREKNTFHFQSFNDQLSGIKVKTFWWRCFKWMRNDTWFLKKLKKILNTSLETLHRNIAYLNISINFSKVGVRRLTRTEDCDEGETQTNQSLQYWSEMNCSEQFGEFWLLCVGSGKVISKFGWFTDFSSKSLFC